MPFELCLAFVAVLAVDGKPRNQFTGSLLIVAAGLAMVSAT